MNFCPNCGKRIIHDGEAPILCSCMEVGYCTKCGSQMKSGSKRKKNGQCGTCANAYTFIINCECHVDDVTVKCTNCGVEPIPFTEKEFEEHETYIYTKHREVAAQSSALNQKKALLSRLRKNKRGIHCRCTGITTCGVCYVSW
jgi:hypothetical protein